MNRTGQPGDRWKPAVLAGVFASVVGTLFVLTPLGNGLANLSYDLLFQLRPIIRPPGVALVYMDEPSAKTLGQPWRGEMWDRTNHARLIDRLVASRARAIVFDVLFDVAKTNDQPFLRAVADAGRAGVPVIVGAKFERSVRAQTYQRIVTPMLLPFSELREIAAWGLVVSEESRERIIRRHVPDEPSMAKRVAELVESSADRGRRTEARWINYYGPPGTIPSASYAEVLNFPHAAKLSNQVIFIGEMSDVSHPGGEVTDDWPTPFSLWGHGKSTGTEINATAYLNVARGDWLTRLPGWSEALLTLVGGILLGFGLTILRPITATVCCVLAIIIVVAIALWAMWQAHVWFPWLIIAGVQALLALSWAVLVQSRQLSREKELLERKIAVLEPVLEMAGESMPVAAALQREAVRRSHETAPQAATKLADATLQSSHPPTAPLVPDHDLLRCVGQGAYGEVWLARNAVGLFHAVKVVRRSAFRSEEPFEREFHGIQRFMPISRLHPGLVQILHVGRNDTVGCIYYIMEAGDDELTGQEIKAESYAPKNLANEIKRRGKLPGTECLHLGLALCSALDFLHTQQLIHRDIKPSNIIFVRGQPKFTDIGLVTEVASTRTDVSYVGTAGYIAPEGPGQPQADVFSLGRVLYGAWTGLPCERYPALPDKVMEWPDRDLALALNKIVIKACNADVVQRYSSAKEMGEKLEALKQ